MSEVANEAINLLGLNTEIEAITFVGITIYLVFVCHLYWILVDFLESFIHAIRNIRNIRRSKKK